MEIRQYIQENEARMLDELFSLIRIPSISALPQHKEDMERCAHRWCELLLQAGAQKAELMPSDGNPLVYAEYIVSPEAPTVLVYAHYDVMPAEPLELWQSEPFEPEVRDGRIWARGADDDKGQGYIGTCPCVHIETATGGSEKVCAYVPRQARDESGRFAHALRRG